MDQACWYRESHSHSSPWKRGRFIQWGLDCVEEGSYSVGIVIDDDTLMSVTTGVDKCIYFASERPI